jgi:hypothetical protein
VQLAGCCISVLTVTIIKAVLLPTLLHAADALRVVVSAMPGVLPG